MKIKSFIKRNIKEIIRDPLSLIFSIGLPLFLLVIFQQFKIPNEVYSLENFAPSIIVFSFGFISLFSGLLISKDRTSSLLTRLYASPMKSFDFIFGYTLSLLPVAIIQSVLFFSVAIVLGLEFSINILLTIMIMTLVSLLFISLGLLIGSIFSDKSAPGASSIIIQLIAFTSGMWFDTSMVGTTFGFICKILPFKYAVDIARNFLAGDFKNNITATLILVTYTVLTYIIVILIFKNKMKSDNK